MSNRSAAYDENQCLKELNDFAKYHNQQLEEAIDQLQQQNPNAIIVYADYYNAYQFLLQHAKSQGIYVWCIYEVRTMMNEKSN